MDDIERVMGEEWLDRADNVFESWSAISAERFLNTLQFQGFKTDDILQILRVTTNYLNALKKNEIDIALEETAAQSLTENLQTNEKETTTEPPTEASQTNTATAPQTQSTEIITPSEAESPIEVFQTNDQVIEKSEIQQAETQVTSQTTADRTSNMIGSDVFIEYVRNYFREEFEQNRTDGQTLDNYIAIQMPPLRSSLSELPGTWQERITHYAQHWSFNDAHAFLNFLENDIKVAPLYIVKGFQAVSFFATTYESFRARFEVYREYLIDEKIKEIIEKKGFTLFKAGKPENIRKLINFLIKYLGEDGFNDVLMNNTSILSFASSEKAVNQLETKKDYLENYLGRGNPVRGEVKLKEIIKNGGFIGFIGFKIYFDEEATHKWHNINNAHNAHIDFLEDTVKLGWSGVVQLMEHNFQAFSTGTQEELNRSYAYLVDYLGAGDEAKGRQIVQRIIAVKKNFFGFASFKVVWDEKTGKWHNTHVTFLDTTLGVKKHKIREFIENNIQAFSGGHLQRSHSFFIDYLADGDEAQANRQLKEIVESNRNFYGFVNFKTHFDRETQKLQNTHVTFLETKLGFTKPEIIQIMKNNLQAFSEGSLAQLELSYTYLVDCLGGGNEGHERLKRIIAKNGGFTGFVKFTVYIRNGVLHNTHVDFLENKRKLNFERSKVIEFMENNLQAFSEGALAELNQAYRYLVNYLGKGNRAKGKRLLKEIIEARGGLHNFIHFKVNEKGEDNYENEVVSFLEQKLDLDQDQIIKLLIETKLQAFPAVNLSELNRSYNYLVNYLGQGNQAIGRMKFGKIIKKKGALSAFVRLRVIEIDGEEKNEIINFLEQVITFQQETVIKIMERDFAKLFESELTEANSKAFVNKLIRIAPNECQEALSA